ncbi:MAG TPA: bifunctional phosphoribosylaminoimidazolecarboxamide formyltransferase/IMP cyclohydrolase [Bacteroidota bacterium]|nr:bifunctional phosphoribosylaminoimidazolecarboxamide formyltransferase/IMP cyclohydrolase [Bacteroidota bacterium]
MNLLTIRRALLSVSNKTGIADLGKRLTEFGVEIISTGGTLKALHDAGVNATSVSDVTGFPEILDGRVKTLHPGIHAALLAVPDDSSHRKQLEELEIEPIDLVVVNLYPFEQTVAKKGITLEEAVEQIDIGGPAMLRSTAKNFKYKTVVVDPADYKEILDEMMKHRGATTEETRFELAQKVFAHTSRYDARILEYFSSVGTSPATEHLPSIFSVCLPKSETLRYGENPHQRAALYGNFHSFFHKLHGKELSYNNIVDIQAAAELLEEFSHPTAVIVKHTNPCGTGSGETLAEAYAKAFATDSKSAYGGIVAVNRALDMTTAGEIDKIFTEVIIAPAYEEGVLEFLKRKKDRRIIRQEQPLRTQHALTMKQIAGGVLVQTEDAVDLLPHQLKVVTKRAPSESERAAMFFAWRVAKHVKSNAIVYARADRTAGIGAGQMSRVDASRIAVSKARDAGIDLHGTAVASDAYFPFADGLLEAVNAGATAVIQPGGSVRDEEVIRAADENHIAMITTGIRHFRH